jgi:hypothetical protein
MRSGTKDYGLDSAAGNAVGERWNPVAVRSYYLCEIRRVVFPPLYLSGPPLAAGPSGPAAFSWPA